MKRVIQSTHAFVRSISGRSRNASSSVTGSRHSGYAWNEDRSTNMDRGGVGTQANLAGENANYDSTVDESDAKTDEMLDNPDLVVAMYRRSLAAHADAIAKLTAEIAEKESALAKLTAEIAEKESALAEKESALAEKESALAEKESALAEKDTQIARLKDDNRKRKLDEFLIFRASGVPLELMKTKFDCFHTVEYFEKRELDEAALYDAWQGLTTSIFNSMKEEDLSRIFDRKEPAPEKIIRKLSDRVFKYALQAVNEIACGRGEDKLNFWLESEPSHSYVNSGLQVSRPNGLIYFGKEEMEKLNPTSLKKMKGVMGYEVRKTLGDETNLYQAAAQSICIIAHVPHMKSLIDSGCLFGYGIITSGSEWNLVRLEINHDEQGSSTSSTPDKERLQFPYRLSKFPSPIVFLQSSFDMDTPPKEFAAIVNWMLELKLSILKAASGIPPKLGPARSDGGDYPLRLDDGSFIDMRYFIHATPNCEVYSGLNTTSGGVATSKFMSRARFKLEVRALRRLANLGICENTPHLIGFGEILDEECIWRRMLESYGFTHAIVTDVCGHSLSDRRDVEFINKTLLPCIGDTLERLGAAGLVHQDIKPANIVEHIYPEVMGIDDQLDHVTVTLIDYALLSDADDGRDCDQPLNMLSPVGTPAFASTGAMCCFPASVHDDWESLALTCIYLQSPSESIDDREASSFYDWVHSQTDWAGYSETSTTELINLLEARLKFWDAAYQLEEVYPWLTESPYAPHFKAAHEAAHTSLARYKDYVSFNIPEKSQRKSLRPTKGGETNSSA